MQNRNKKKFQLQRARARRTRAALQVRADKPRLSVFRSLKHISGQVINHEGKVLASASDLQIKGSAKLKGVLKAHATGKLLAQHALAHKVTKVVFDKSHYKYHGRVKAFADGAREGGLTF